MSDLYHPSLPYAQDRQRERMRTAKTGVDTAAGFVCGMCHSPRRVS